MTPKGDFGSGAFRYDPSAHPGEPHRGVGKAVLAPVVLRQKGVAVLVCANATFSELSGRTDAATKLVSFECVSHWMASSVSIVRIGSTSLVDRLFPVRNRVRSEGMSLTQRLQIFHYGDVLYYSERSWGIRCHQHPR